MRFPYPPQLNHLYTVARGRKILSTKGRQYKETVQMICMVKKVKPLDGDVKVIACFYRPRKSGDLDNVLKALLDSVKGYLWHDDKQVIEIHAYRYDDKDDPRVELSAEALND